MTVPTATAEAEAPAANPLDTAIPELVRTLNGQGRTDLAERATAAGARLKRPNTIVCVVGEFKQGKSSLVNAMLGVDLCPVDDDLATSAITLIRYGEQTGAVVRRKEGSEQVAEAVPISELSQWCSERGNPGNHKGVQRVDMTVNSAMLKQGLMVVDTPGMGGLGAGHAAATLSFLPFADGLMLVSDASAELSAPEIEFLRRAQELCPTVLFVQTKIDLYPAWERIFELNKGHLAAAGLDLPAVAASSALRHEALARKDRSLNERSRFPELITALGERVVTPAKQQAGARSAADVRAIISLVRAGLEQEQSVINDPARLQTALADLAEAKEKLEGLRGPGSKWATLLSDRVSDLSSRVTHEFRSAMRTTLRDTDAAIEQLAKGDEWDELVRELQTVVANAVTEAFVTVEQGRAAIRADIAALLRDEELPALTTRGSSVQAVDVTDLWQEKGLDTDGTGAKAALKHGLTGLRGAQGGVVMFGMLGSFLPATVATLIASNPVMLGAGAVFGGMQLLEDRKRRVTMRRQNARQQMRQFIDDVQFEVTDQLTALIRDVQRVLRDEFSERLAELQRTFTATAQRAQETAKSTQEEQQRRSVELQQELSELGKIDQIAASVTGGAT